MPELIQKAAAKVGEVNVAMPILFGVLAVLVLGFLIAGATLTKNTEKRTSYIVAAVVVLLLVLAFASISAIVAWVQS